MGRIEEELRIEICSVMGRTIGESEEERRYRDKTVVHAAPLLGVAKYLNEFAHLFGRNWRIWSVMGRPIRGRWKRRGDRVLSVGAKHLRDICNYENDILFCARSIWLRSIGALDPNP
uniref:Uncharacterized protein n=1 Tax=Kalanchoe fedtschenkoi TaxID=63787 RepID=A0A7N0U3W2_KALFE